MSQERDHTDQRPDLDEVLADYMRRTDRGEHVDPESLIRAHPDLAEELRECFAHELALNRLISAAESQAQQSVDVASEVVEKIQPSSADFQSSSTASGGDQSATQAQNHSITSGAKESVVAGGSRIGPYELLHVLGEGGYGVVYLAIDVDLERSVAIKLAKREKCHSPDQIKAFLGEARRVAQLRHPSIVNIFDVSRGDNDPWYLVMEFIDGPSLAEVYRSGELSIVAVIELLVQVGDAIHYAHSNGILHRDLKPANVLLGKKDRLPRIVDFGMALHEREQFSAPRFPAGTPYCMSPEQVRGETHRLDARTDIWSLGVMLYEGLSGKRPFTGENVSGVFEVILQNDPEPLTQINPCVPVELERICLKCLSKRMGDRYSSAAELAADLRRWLSDASGSSGKDLSATERRARKESTSESPVVPRGLRSFGSEDAGFFLDLLPGPRNRDGLPESIDMWLNAIENPGHQSQNAALVLYGPTGSGKSSFVRAGLLPRLDPATSTICLDSAAAKLEQQLLRGLHHVCPDLPARVSLVQACSLIRTGAVPRFDGKVLIVLDQFEQWLHANNGRLSGELAMALRQCDGERLQCLMVVRSDFWLGITRFLRELEVPLIEGSNSAHLDLFDVRHARRVLTAFGRSYGSLPSSDEPLKSEQSQFLEQAAEQVAADGWIVPVRLAVFAEMMKGQEWTLDVLRELGGERGLRVAYLDKVFASPLAAPSHRRYRKPAEAILRALLPEAGVELKGRCRTRHELKRVSGLADREDRFIELMDILDSQLRLITPTEAAEVHDRAASGTESSIRLPTVQPSYQLTHDYLVPALREWLSREQQSTAEGRARLCLEERDRQWRQTPDARYLPSLTEIVRICALTHRNSWTASQRVMIRKAVARNFRQVVVSLFTAAVLATMFSALYYATKPPDPLAVFQNSSLPVDERMRAFDKLDMSSVAALGPVIYTMKREEQPQVLRHAIGGMWRYVTKLRTAAPTGGDSVRELIRTESGDLLARDVIVGGEDEDQVRSELFSIYAALAPSSDVLQFAADAYERNRPLGQNVLIAYLKSPDARELLKLPASSGQPALVSERAKKNVTNLVRLMDSLPSSEEKTLVADLVGRLPAGQVVDLFTAAFMGTPYDYAERSMDIYLRALPPGDRRQTEARRLLPAASSRLSKLLNESKQHDSLGQELEFVLASIQHLQPAANLWDQELFANVRSVFARRKGFPDSAVVDVACATYATLYVHAPSAAQLDAANLQPLREILAGMEESVDFRCAAAKALATIDDPVVFTDLAGIATSTSAPLRLRSDAIISLGSIGRRRQDRNQDARGVSGVLVELFDADEYHSEDLLADVVREVADMGRLEDLEHVLSVLQRKHHDLNVNAQDAVFQFIIGNPAQAEQICEKALVTIAGLSDEARNSLFPSAEQFLSDIMRLRHSCDPNLFKIAYRRMVEGLANLSARHEERAVRSLATQNINQLLEEMPTIDPDATTEERERTLVLWREEWTKLADQLPTNVELPSTAR